MSNKKFGYARVSTAEQNEDRQVLELLEYGIEERDIYVDKQSGRSFERTNYMSLRNSILRSGDILVVKSIDRFGRNYHSILHHKPTMPLTMLQKRWLKALLSDPRIALFDPDTTGLEDVDPLYAQDTFILFDQYADGDPYGDPAYIACFQTALKAIRKKRKLRIRFRGHTGARHSIECIPYRLEYSAKDDKFRLLATGKRRLNTINMARVRSCELLDAYDPKSITLPQENSEELVMLLHDERNGLERVLLHFSHFEKETQKLADRLYQIRLRYDKDDETELLIRVLSFGPVLEVIEPSAFVTLMRKRIAVQKQRFCQ